MVVATVFISACQMPFTEADLEPLPTELPPPLIIRPPGANSTQTPEQVAHLALADIGANARQLGYAISPARIIRIQLLLPGEAYRLHRLDGSPIVLSLGPAGGPAWVVEAVGTYVGLDPRDPAKTIHWKGAHGFFLYADDGSSESYALPCWVLQASEDVPMEGQC